MQEIITSSRSIKEKLKFSISVSQTSLDWFDQTDKSAYIEFRYLNVQPV